jgi:hypothetical protein
MAASYWQEVPAAATNKNRVIDLLWFATSDKPPVPSLEYANVAWLPSVNVAVAVPTIRAALFNPQILNVSTWGGR